MMAHMCFPQIAQARIPAQGRNVQECREVRHSRIADGAYPRNAWRPAMPADDSRLTDDALMREAVALARNNMRDGGRPFGAVLAFEGRVVARGVNEILASHDPTAHAEIQAIRHASRALGRPRLDGCVVYASGHPCPMC